MKYLDDKTAMKGDAVLFQAPGTDFVHAGNVHELYDRTEDMRVTGYALRVPANICVLAQSAWEAYSKPLLEAKAKEEAEAKAKLENPPPPPA